MKVEVYLSNDLKKFTGIIDNKDFDYTVEEFIVLISSFQQAIAKVQNIQLCNSLIIPIGNITDFITKN